MACKYRTLSVEGFSFVVVCHLKSRGPMICNCLGLTSRAYFRVRNAFKWTYHTNRERSRSVICTFPVFYRTIHKQSQKRGLPTNTASFTSLTDEKQAVLDTPYLVTKPYDPDANLKQNAKWSTLDETLNPKIIKAIYKIFKYRFMTDLQETLMNQLPLDGNKLVRSKTGTGKTLGYLIPALQRTLDKFGGVPSNEIGMSQISVLVLTPTRELAHQTAREARRLMVYTSTMKAQCFTGGTLTTTEMREFDRHRTDFLIATPGRLLEYLRSTERVNNHLGHIHTLIIDEADLMIDMGFAREVEAIQEFLPANISTYMFSATFSKKVQVSAKKYMRGEYETINTIRSTDLDVHERVKQSYIICPSEDRIKSLLDVILGHQHRMTRKKIIIFMPTAYSTMFTIRLFKLLRRCYIDMSFQQFEIHSLRSQEDRLKVSKAFRSAGAESALFTTDVSARGLDYPNVDLVIHLGMAFDREQYIHRIGRTARVGREGESIMILDPLEKEFVKELTNIPITEWKNPNRYISQRKFNGLFCISCGLVEDELKQRCLESLYKFCKSIYQ